MTTTFEATNLHMLRTAAKTMGFDERGLEPYDASRADIVRMAKRLGFTHVEWRSSDALRFPYFGKK